MNDVQADAKKIFLGALDCASPEDLSSYLGQACAGDAALRARVEELLRARREAGSFLGGDWASATQDMSPLSEAAGTVIGPYKLLQEIGEGGMGVVFMAEQSEPLQRTVALKIIKPGMDTRQVIARFEAERQAVAMMDHPNIAKVLDAGTTDSGRPYFVMELVKGVPITKYCDEKQLPLPARLELFIQVCQAVQHAHQKGIIHRDIKPNNVLVAEYDNQAVPKVIDFGVAKATAQRLTERTMFTEFGQVLGTMEYMSPEQSKFNQLDIDTRSDIYSLGVLLYELLAGSTPFEGKRLHEAAFDEMLRIIREEEPPKPSTRLSSSDALASIAANRGLEPLKLNRLVRGELDWIVMKSLEKDRNRRYETASGFASDIERHLHEEPVEAGPPSKTYRLRKLARKHRTAIQVGAAFVLLLIATTIFSSWQTVRATRAKAVALAEKQRADEQAAVATRTTEYLQDLLRSANPDASKGPDYTVRELLDDFADTLDARLADQPEIAAVLHTTIAGAYWGLSDYDKAKLHSSQALELRRTVFGTQHEKYADSLAHYGRMMNPDDPTGHAQGEADIRQALAIYRARRITGKRIISALSNLQLVLCWQHKYKDIELVADEARAEARKSPGVDYSDLAGILGHLAWAKTIQGEPAEAERIQREVVATHIRVYGAEHIWTAWSYSGLGSALEAQHKFREALETEKKSLVMMQRLLSPGHQAIGHPLNTFIDTLVVARDSHALAELFPSVEQLTEVESFLRQIQATGPSVPDDYWDPATLASRGLGQCPDLYLELSKELSAAGRTQEADESRQKGIALLDSLRSEFTANPEMLAWSYGQQIRVLMSEGHREQASDLVRKMLALKARDKWVLNDAAWRLATAQNPAQRDPALAVELAKKNVRFSSDTAYTWTTLGVARYCAGDWKQAIPDLEKSVKRRNGGNSIEWFFLAMAHWQLGHREEARDWYDKAVEWMEMNQPKNEQLLRFRAEAEELLKITDEKPMTKPPVEVN
jgi:serine/threonine protein kinase/Tfp pilus assembly protein PilF